MEPTLHETSHIPSYSSFAPRTSNHSTSSSTASEDNFYQRIDQAQEAINMDEHHQSNLEKFGAMILKNVAYFRQF
uniref:Uncharacterized protein n=1 Tax=Panagrolaimus sp. ES5 TaxID=591445 RepID=A0AC34G945_9BILA